MKPVKLTPEKRQELTNWLMEIPAKFANPVLQFLQENEEIETAEDGGGSPKPPKPPKPGEE